MARNHRIIELIVIRENDDQISVPDNFRGQLAFESQLHAFWNCREEGLDRSDVRSTP